MYACMNTGCSSVRVWMEGLVCGGGWHAACANLSYLTSPFKISKTAVKKMEKSSGRWRNKVPLGQLENTPSFTTPSRDVSARPHIIKQADLSWSKLDVERKPVRIRPPSPRLPPPREHEFNRSRSCEALPKPIIRRRARSLPSSMDGKKHHRSLGVRFVDALGVDLADVKVFKSGEDPLVPEHVTFRLLMGAELAGGKNLEISLPYFKPMFAEQPGDQRDFHNRLRNQRVCLEKVLCFELGIIGIIQVLNFAFEKEVGVRYSFTDWKGFAENKAVWVSTTELWAGTGDKLSCDTFRFHLPVPPFILQPGAVLEFAVRYKVSGQEFWDSNGGKNYKLACHSYKLNVPKECENSMVHFI